MLRNESAVPGWAVNHTAQSWDGMPDGYLKQCEVVGGSVRLGGPPSRRHQMAVNLIWAALRRPASEIAAVSGEDVHVLPSAELRLEDDPLHQVRPDVIVARSATLDAPATSGDLLLAVEIVEPTSHVVDTVHKVGEYAAAGVPHYWMVETRDGAISTVTWYALPEDDKRYEVRACWTPAEAPEGIRADEPFPVRIAWDELAF